jgi:hypothetical protein
MRASGPGESAKLLLDVVDVLAARSNDYAAGATGSIVRSQYRPPIKELLAS